MRSADDRRASRQQGLHAEDFVADALRADGFQILGQNVHVGGGELDLVALRDGALRFVEVKARSVGDDSALESVGRTKRRRVQRAAESWLQGDVPAYEEVAFMVAAVTLDPGGWHIEWLDDAFDAEGW